jgi:CheY-like chemotaxis protein
MLPRVFDMFAQVDRTLSRSQGGLGIGLTLAKNLVQMHGGRIDASSAGLGHGSEFTIRLPLVSEAPYPHFPMASPPADTQPLPVRRILAVDDTRAAAFTLAKLLEKMGQRVWTAADGDAALQIARTERPEVIISDIAMPNMDGYELARQLRQEPGFERVVLVALTGFGQESDRERAREAGFDHHLIKPVDVAALQELLAALPAPPHRTVS